MSIFKFEPISDARAKELKYGLWADGMYQFVVLDSEETVSKNGNPMIKVVLELVDGNKTRKITDYLLLDPNSNMRYKLKHFCDSIGLEKEYEAGQVDTQDLIGKGGNAEVYTQESKDPQYQDRNAISDYVKRMNILGHKLTEGAKVVNEIQDDSIPF